MGENAFWKSLSFIGACVGAVVALALDLALGTAHPGSPDLIRFVGRFHPLVVHLPIGFLILVGFAESLTLLPKVRARIDPALGLLLAPLLASAVGAFTLGLLLARDGGYPSKLVALHRNFTLGAVIGSALCLAVWSAQTQTKDGARRTIYRAALGLTLGLVTVGAHFGGSITRGESYLTKYAPAFAQKWLGGAPKEIATPVSTPGDAAADPLVYRDVVAPVLKLRCVECHGESTMKASLRLDSLDAIKKGGENGPVVVPGRSADSGLVQRMLMPSDKDEHMPPEGKTGPTPEEIEVIRFWIDRGATDTLHVRDALASDSARSVLAKAVSSGDATPTASSPAPSTSASAAPSGEPSATPSPTSTAGTSVSPPSSSGSGVASHSGLAWDDAVEPLLVSRCGKCHGAEKQKGKLRVDSIAALLAGGKGGPAIAPGDLPGGTLLTRVRMPLESEDHMPPKKEAQLTATEIDLLAYWIQHGAGADLKTSTIPASLRASSAPTPPTSPTATPTASTAEPVSTAVPPNPAIDPTTLPADVRLYADVVKPILDTRCGLCHSGESPSGELDVDNHAALLKSGAIVPGKITQSKIIQRVVLPARDSDHMPPDGNEQTERGEIDALKLWISKGAAEDLVVPAKSLSPDVAYAAAFMIAKTKADASAPPPAPPDASASPSPSASASDVASGLPAPSAGATHAQEPPSLGPGSGCAACTIGNDDTPLWLAVLASAIGLGMLVTRRSRRRTDDDST